MNRNRANAIVCYIVAALFYIVAIIYILDKTTKMGIAWLGLGSAWLCIGLVHFRKSQNKDGNLDSDDE